MLGLAIGFIFSLGAINAFIPILIILILLVAAAGLNRGYSLFAFFGLSTLSNANPGGKSSIVGKTGFGFAGAGFVGGGGKLGSALGVGKKARARLNRAGRNIAKGFAITGAARELKKRGTTVAQLSASQPSGSKAKTVSKAIGRAVFIDKPSKSMQKAMKTTLGRTVSQKVASVSKPISGASGAMRSGVGAARQKASNIGSAIGRTRAGRIAKKYSNTKAGKATTLLTKAALISSVGTPFAGAAYLVYKGGAKARAAHGRKPPEGGYVKHSISEVKKQTEGMRRDLLFVALPGVYIFSRAKAGARRHEELRAEALSGKGNEAKAMGHASALIEKRGGSGGFTGRMRDTISTARALNRLEREERNAAYTNRYAGARNISSYKVGTNRPILTAAPIGIANVISAGWKAARDNEGNFKLSRMAGGARNRIKENVQAMGKSDSSLTTAKLARTIADASFLSLVSISQSKLAKNVFHSKREPYVSPELRQQSGLRPYNEKHIQMMSAVLSAKIARAKNPDELNPHLSRIQSEISAMGYNPYSSENRVAQAGHPKNSGKASDNDEKLKERMESTRETAIKGILAQSQAIARNPNASPDQLRYLGGFSDKEVRHTVASNSKTPADVLNNIYTGAAAAVAAAAASKKDAKEPDTEEVKKEKAIRDSVLSNKNVPPEAVQKYIDDTNEERIAEIKKLEDRLKENERLRASAADSKNPNESASLSDLSKVRKKIELDLNDMRKGKDELYGNITKVKLNLIDSQNVTEEKLRELAKDSNSVVSKRAQAALEKLMEKKSD